MCAVCRKNPCDSRCPNAEEPKSICTCEWCDIISRERSKLRDRLLQSHRYFTSPEKNPLHAWSEMEADAFWSMFKEYENAKGNGHMHTVVQPEMRALEVIPMHEDAKIAELMGSRK